MFEVNINKNNSLEALQQLVEQNFSKSINFPDSFNQKQQEALELFKQRIYLEKIIDESISFNRSLNFPNENKKLHLTTTAEELIEVFKLRSEVYAQINYQREFPDPIEGLNFDDFDTNSGILYYKNEQQITGTIRVIFDSTKLLPSEEKITFSKERKNYDAIAELSRLTVLNEKKSLNFEFRDLTQGVYYLTVHNKIDLILSGIKQDHYKLYSKFGGIEIKEELSSYGSFSMPCLILSWDPHMISPFFKKAFLKQK